MNYAHKDYKKTKTLFVQRGFKDWRTLMIELIEELRLSPLYVAYLNKKENGRYL